MSKAIFKKQRYEYYKGTKEIIDNELDEYVEDVVDRLNTQDYNKKELLKVKQNQDQQIAELKAENKKLQQQLKDNTKQVCEKIKSIYNESCYMNRYNNIDKETLFYILDQIEKGERNAKD